MFKSLSAIHAVFIYSEPLSGNCLWMLKNAWRVKSFPPYLTEFL